MMNDWTTTVDHDEIKLWSEAHHGKPEVMEDDKLKEPEIRLDFPGKSDDVYLAMNLGEHTVTWGKFFEIFEKQNLAFEYNKQATGSDMSREYRFIKRTSIK